MSYSKSPNIIFIVSDQHRGDWLGSEDCPFVETPNLDYMAEHGVKFREAYCNSPLCVPSRMSMLTGRYPHQIEVYDNGSSLNSYIPTYAHALGLAGYETVLCGRMHFEGPDQRHGYQQRRVGDITPCYLGGPKGPLNPKTAGRHMESVYSAGPGESSVMDYDEAVTEDCEHFLENWTKQEQEKPLFLTVGYYGPHHPFTCPLHLFEKASKAVEAYDEPISIDREPLHPWLKEWFRVTNSDQATKEDISKVRAAYAGLISKLDQNIGRVLEAAQDLQRDTYIIYLSDHGEMAGDRSMFWKWSFFEGSVKIPMIWYALKEQEGTSKLNQGVVVDHLVSLLDIAPTFAGITGAPVMPNTVGNDLTPLLFSDHSKMAQTDQQHPTSWEERAVFAELLTPESISPVRMVRWKQYKLIYYHGFEPVQLFDIQNDPHEKHDLNGKSGYSEIKKYLLQLILKDWDPQEIKDKSLHKQKDKQYMVKWGNDVGMGPSDLWKTKEQYESGKVRCRNETAT